MREWRQLEERHRQIAQAYADGEKVKSIAMRFGLSITSVKRIRARWGCTIRKRGRPRIE